MATGSTSGARPAGEDERPAIEVSLGEAVRGQRLRQGLTLQELSLASGVSTAMLSRIERGQVTASISTLDAIARALQVPLANLFADTAERSEISFVKAGGGVEVRRFGSRYGHAYKLIGKLTLPHLSFEPYLITIERDGAGAPLFQHPGAEFIQVVEGAMRYRCGPETFDLEPGDSLSFDATAPHGPVEILTERVSFLTLIAALKT